MKSFFTFLLLIACGTQVTDARSMWSVLRGGSVSIQQPPPQAENQRPYYAQDEVTVQWEVQLPFGKSKKQAAPAGKVLSTKLEEIVHSFQRVEVKGGADIHVGKLLSSFRKMKTFMEETGMSQVAKTLTTNIDKVEALYRLAPADQRDSLRALLRYEVELGVHGDANSKSGIVKNLEENSGAMGLAWLGRNLSYQCYMYHLMLEEGKPPLEASQLAFERHLKPHLHWAVAKILRAAISSLTPSKQSGFFSTIGGFSQDSYGQDQDHATKRDVGRLVDLWQPLLAETEAVFRELRMESAVL